MRPIILNFFLLVVFIAIAFGASGQICTGSLGDPVVDETFGVCTNDTGIGPPLPPGVTTLMYSNSPCSEGAYTYGLITGMMGCQGGTWQTLYQDHTGNHNGYFMLINGPNSPEVVYTQKVDGSTLCPNTTYEFAAWIMNVLVLSQNTADWALPNLTFSIETSSGQVLKTITIGDIPETVQPVWNQYGTFFTTPSDGSDIIVNLIDNQTGTGNGNDFAVDDITFRPCGPIINEGFNITGDTTSRQMCVGNSATYNLVASQQGYDNPAYQWQESLNGSNNWVDIPGAVSLTLSQTFSNATAGLYRYRIGVLSASNSSLACRIYSQPLNIIVNPLMAPIAPITAVCTGQPLTLSASQGDTYQWTGPNGFSSNEQYPLVDNPVQAADTGIYTVTVTFKGCPATSSTMVKITPKIVGVISNDTTICQGSAATLSATQSQGATTFSWAPAAGLDQTDQATVNASPAQTTTYTLSLGNGGCVTVTRLVTVTVVSKPTANAGLNKHLMAGDSVKLNGSVSGDSVTYYWTPGTYLDNPKSLTPMASPVNNTIYTLHAQSNYNCGEDTSNVFIRVYQKLTIPNTFTPNNDGVNDYWDIKNLDTYPECSVLVFDRYGRQVYQSNGYNKSWDGAYGGSKLPTGTYYYIIDLKNDTPKISGWVLIVH
jgi:gliding motility-associated-like protein